MNPTRLGRRVDSDAGPRIVLTRTFRAPVEDVWAAVTEPERLARWIGTWSGDPAEGWVSFTMTAEEGAAAERMEIRTCEPPRHLALSSQAGDQRWDYDVDLSEADGVTTLELSQWTGDVDTVDSAGPGWEYYLDRLVAAETGADPEQVDWERDYYPALREHYRSLFA